MVVKKLRVLTRRRDTAAVSCVLYWLQLPFTQLQTFLGAFPIIHYYLSISSSEQVSTLCRYLGSQQCSDLTPDRGDVIMLLVLWIQGMSVKLQYSSFFFVLKESAKTLHPLPRRCNVSTRMRAWVWRLVAGWLRRLSPTCCFSVSHLADKGLYAEHTFTA